MYSAVSAVGEKRFGRWVRVEGIFSHARMKTADVRSGTRGHSQMMTGELLLPQRCGNGSRFGSVVGSYWRYHHHVLALARSDGGKNNRKHFSLTRLNLQHMMGGSRTHARVNASIGTSGIVTVTHQKKHEARTLGTFFSPATGISYHIISCNETQARPTL